MKKNRIFALGLALILCVCSLTLPAFAADTGAGSAGYGVAVDGTTFNRHGDSGTNGGTHGGGTTGSLTDNKAGSGGYYGHIESPDEILGMTSDNVVTTTDVDDWVNRKGNDLVGIITKGVQYVSVFGFFGALFLIVVGALGNKRTMVAGLIALMASCVVFTAATCAPQIMAAVRGWLVT